MPAKFRVLEAPEAVGSDASAADPQNRDLAAPGSPRAAEALPPTASRAVSDAERRSDARTAERRQRIAADNSPTPPQSRRARRGRHPTEPTSAQTSPRLMTFRDSTSLALIALLATGGILGTILGALGTSGWIIGLLVAGMTVVLSALLRRYGRST